MLAFFGSGPRLSVGEDWVSDCYGRRTKAPVCHASAGGSGRRDLITLIVPYTVPTEVSVEAVHADGGYVIAIRRPESLDVVGCRTEPTLKAAVFSTDAELVWTRREADAAGPEALAMLGGKGLEFAGARLERGSIGNAFAARTGDGWRASDADTRVVPELLSGSHSSAR